MSTTNWIAYSVLAAVTVTVLWLQERDIRSLRRELADTGDDLYQLWQWAHGIDDHLRADQPTQTPDPGPETAPLNDAWDDVVHEIHQAHRPQPIPRGKHRRH
jgi:hypothetical protein